jgi:hypothetical protein
MVIAVPPVVDVIPLARPDSAAAEDTWFQRAPVPVDRGLFDRAMRAASMAWHPDGILPPPAVTQATMALPAILEAWRSIERQLVGLTGDSPHQEFLEANATMLGAMYQRLYLVRMRR